MFHILFTTEDVDLLWIKAENFGRLMQLIKENFSTIKINQEIIQVLTLAPVNWTIKKVANFFMLQQSMLLVKLEVLFREKGLLAVPDKKMEKTYLKMQLIWLKYSMVMMHFLNKCLEKRLY